MASAFFGHDAASCEPVAGQVVAAATMGVCCLPLKGPATTEGPAGYKGSRAGSAIAAESLSRRRLTGILWPVEQSLLSDPMYHQLAIIRMGSTSASLGKEK